MNKLAKDAALTSLTGVLKQKRVFVRKVVENFYGLNVDRAVTNVRIGIQGTGKTPHYKFEYPMCEVSALSRRMRWLCLRSETQPKLNHHLVDR